MASRPLRIGVDGRELAGKPTGVGRYVRQVLNVWHATPDFPHTLTVFLPAPPAAELTAAFPKIRWGVVPHRDGGTLWEQTRLPAAIAKADTDVFFAAGYTAPLRVSCPFVVAVYDVSFFAHREWFRPREGFRRRWLTRRAAHRAASVVTISEFSAGEIVQWLGIARERVRLAAPGTPPKLEAFGPVREPMVLFVGSIFNRRHVPELIRAVALVRRRIPAARLVIVGDNRTNPHVDFVSVAREVGAGDGVEWREYVDDAELMRLYGSARAFAFLSDYEGFAMTPMEALAHGVPSVLLDTPVAREVYGDGALRVPLDVEDIARAITALLSDEEVRSQVLAHGVERMASYTWEHCANAIQRALEEAADS